MNKWRIRQGAERAKGGTKRKAVEEKGIIKEGEKKTTNKRKWKIKKGKAKSNEKDKEEMED